MSGFPNSPPPHTAPPGAPPGPPPGAPPTPQSLTPEEQKVIQSCQSESFWYRSIPLSALLASGAHFGVIRGYLKPHPSWGARPKVILGSIVGYFLGKFSYVDVCADKFLAEAPDSNIAETIRARRGLASRRAEQPVQEQEGSPYQPVQQPSPIYQNQASPTYGQQGLYQEQQQQEQVGAGGGYDDLRKRNREAQAAAGGAPQSGAGGAPYTPLSMPIPPAPAAPDYPVSRARVIQPQGQGTNKYGDEGFE